MGTRLAAAGLFVALLFSFTSCRRPGSRWEGTVEERDGVRIVHNPREPLYADAAATFEEDLRIGREDGEPEYVLRRPAGIDVDDQGRIYVLDEADAEVRVFDGDGRFVRTMGRKGQGPGEMQRPMFIRASARGEVMVVDYSAARALFFSREGAFLRQLTTFRPVIPLGLDPLGNVVGMEILAPPPMGGKVIKKYDPEFRPLLDIAKEDMGARGVFDIGKPSCYGAVAPDGSLTWGDSSAYELFVLDPAGRLVRKVTRDHASRPIEAKDREEYEQRYADALKAGLKIAFRSHYPAFSDILMDDRGRLFVKTWERVAGTENAHYFDIFSRDGIFLAKDPMVGGFDRRSVWKNGKLYTVDQNGIGFPVIRRYRVTWTDLPEGEK